MRRALRRGDEFLYGPGGDTTLQVGDVLLLQGPADGVDVVRGLAGGTPHQLPPPTEHPRLSELDRAVDLCVDLKDASEVAVGLAYSAILLRDRALADEVTAIEARTDQLWADLEGWAGRRRGRRPPHAVGSVPHRRGRRAHRRRGACDDPTRGQR